MKILIDVNVVLDVLLARDPWFREATRLLSAVEVGRIRGFLASHTVTTIHYIVSTNRDRRTATAAVSDLLGFLEIVPVDAVGFREALALGYGDLEDAVQAICALRVDADTLVTRNEENFPELPIPVEPPGAVTARL